MRRSGRSRTRLARNGRSLLEQHSYCHGHSERHPDEPNGALRDRKIFVDPNYLAPVEKTRTWEQSYLLGELRAKLLMSGVRLVERREGAEIILEVRAAAIGVEKRLREVYEGYRQVSQHKATVGGSPAVEFRFQGKADEHDWSGTLVVISRSTDIFTVLGMTYADSDLIQIQENVIGKAVGSLSFDVK